MAFTYNHCALGGNLTRDPELRSTSKNPVCKFTVAVNRRFRVGEEQREETLFLDCEAWGRTAEVAAQYLSKGSPVFVDGNLKQDNWEDKDGNKRSRIVLNVRNLQFVGSRQAASTEGNREQSMPVATREPVAAYEDEPPF